MSRTTRKIKLQPKHRSGGCQPDKIVPELRINGKWLSDHGFKPGDHVMITVKSKKLTIKPL